MLRLISDSLIEGIHGSSGRRVTEVVWEELEREVRPTHLTNRTISLQTFGLVIVGKTQVKQISVMMTQ